MIEWSRIRRSAVIAMAAAAMTAGSVAGAMAQQDAAEVFEPEGCWSDDARIEPDTEADNVVLYPQWDSEPEMVIDQEASYIAVISTNKGDMTFGLTTDAAPTAVNNFICLATHDYYDVTPFHRVVAGFMVQGGDPTGTGAGDPGYRFAEELPGDDLAYMRGTLAMARTQEPNSQGSQFFIVHQDQDGNLAKDYTIFGQMIDGESVLDDIADSAVVPGLQGESSNPVEFLVIEDVTIRAASAS